MVIKLGVLKRLDPREAWANEARDFTPWLAENLDQLGTTLGMDLELVEREADVGDFSLDILARDLGRNCLVVIENQLGATDHDHLGKLLTYAAGHDAGVIVWLARDFREEHRQTLDWLNQRNDGNLEFFGVVVELLRIDESSPAANLRLVASPNSWRQAALRAGEAGAPSPRREAYRSFFQGLIDELREKHRFTGARIAQAQNWYQFASGISGILYAFAFAQQGQVRAELYLTRGTSVNKALFDRLQAEQQAIEREFGEPLQWERLDEGVASRIAIYRPGSIDSPDTLGEIRSWAIERLLRMKKVLGPRIAGLVGQEDPKPET